MTLPAPSEPPAGAGGRPPRRFAAALAVLLLAYLALQVVYVLRLPLVMDEFQGAAAVQRLSEGVPYRDFRPYKTVLGYYVQLPVLLAAPDPWSAMLWVKLEMALLTAAVLAWAALRLARRLRPGAVLAALALLLATSNFLERSAELRVDTPTALAGLVCLVHLVAGGRRGDAWAGAWAAVAFLVSQKGAFYALAGGAALLAAWLVRRHRGGLAAGLRFALAGLAVAAAYYGFWALVAGGDVLDVTVGPAQRVLDGDYRLRGEFWSQTLVRNPVFWGLSAAALVAAAGRARRGEEPALRLAVFAAVLTALCAWYEQPWPYFFVLLLPALAVLLAEGFDVVARDASWARQPRRVRRLLVAGLLLAGVAVPLVTRVPKVMARDNGFQRYTLELARAVLEPGDTYLAGVDLLWERRQASARLSWIDQPRQRRLHALPPGEMAALVDELRRSPMKLVIYNYRIADLPPALEGYLGSRFRHLAANVFTYSPVVAPGDGGVALDFGGTYVVELAGRAACRVGGRPVDQHARLELAAGPHAVDCAVPLRLSFVPSDPGPAPDPAYRQPRSFFPHVYHY